MIDSETSKCTALDAARTCGALLGSLLLLTACKGGSAKKAAPSPAVVPVEAPKPAPVQPVVERFEPASGAPGTLIVIHGDHFTDKTEVVFGAQEKARTRRVDGRTLKAWVPEGATTGPIVVGRTPSATPFTVLASRMATLEQPFVPVVKTNDLLGAQVDFPAPRRTKQYEELSYPKAPLFHPYHPLDDATGSFREDRFFCQVTLNLHLPEAFFPALPHDLQAKVRELGLKPGQVEVLVVSQDQPWLAPMLFRPHYWTDPEAPRNGTYHTHHPIQAGLFGADPAVHFVGHTPGEWVKAEVIVHPEGNGDPASTIVSSPDNLAVAGLNAHQSQAFWSLTRCGDRAAATLHLLLNDADQATLEGLLPVATTLRALLDHLQTTPLAATPVAASLKALARPLVTGLRPSHLSGELLILTGSGLRDASIRTADGKPLQRLPPNTDTELMFIRSGKLQEGTSLLVTTPLGESEPYTLKLGKPRQSSPNSLTPTGPSPM